MLTDHDRRQYILLTPKTQGNEENENCNSIHKMILSGD